MDQGVLARMRERKLFQWLAAYLAGAWLALQLADLAADAFGWPAAVLRGIWVVAGAGLLAALVLAWYHGEQGHQRVGGIELLMLAAVLLVAGTGLAMVARPDASGSLEAAPASFDAEPEAASVVVLPFSNVSEDEDQAFFADGLTEEVLNRLARVPGLRVPGRNTSFALRDRGLPTAEIARQAGVAHVLSGSVRREGSQLRVTAELVDARGDHTIWSQQYDRQLAGVFAVQEEIAGAVVDAIRLRLSGDATARGLGDPEPGGTHQPDPAVHELYLRGLHAWNRRTPALLRQAERHFREAVERDPAYAEAWAGLALTYVVLPEWEDTLPGAYPARTRDAATRALALDPSSAEAYTALGGAQQMEGRLDAAETAFARAIEANPAYPTAHQWLCSLLNSEGRAAEALRQCEEARSLDPLSFIINANVADQVFYLRDYDRALTLYDKALELDPEGGNGFYQAQFAVALLAAGRDDEAERWARRVLAEHDVDNPITLAPAAYVLARLGDTATANGVAARLEVRAHERFVSPAMRSYLAMGLGRYDRALELLAEAVDVMDTNLRYYIATDPLYDPVREDPRYVAAYARFLGK